MLTRSGAALTLLIVMVLVTATASLTLTATSTVKARAEQLRRERAKELQRMLDAGTEWVRGKDLAAADDAGEPSWTLILPSRGGEEASASQTSIEKAVLVELEADERVRLTAELRRIHGQRTAILASRTIRVARANATLDPAPVGSAAAETNSEEGN